MPACAALAWAAAPDHFALAVPVRHRPAIPRHPFAQVLATDGAASQPALIAVLAVGGAADSSRANPVGECQRGLLPAQPGNAVVRHAGLPAFWRIDVEDANPRALNVEGVTIDRRRAPGDRRIGSHRFRSDRIADRKLQLEALILKRAHAGKRGQDEQRRQDPRGPMPRSASRARRPGTAPRSGAGTDHTPSAGSFRTQRVGPRG